MRVGGDRLDAAEEDVVELAHPVRGHVQDRDVGAHAGGDLGRVGTDDSPADDHDVGRRDAGDACEQHAAAAVGLLEVVGADVHAHAARDLGHRRQQRQRPVVRRDRLVGHAGDLALEEHVGQGPRRGEVKVGVQDLAGAQPLVLGADRLLDLDDHLGFPEDLVGRPQDPRARGFELIVGDARAHARLVLDQHRVPGRLEGLDARRHQADPILVVFDLLGQPDDHRGSLLSPRPEGHRRAQASSALRFSACRSAPSGACPRNRRRWTSTR